VARLDRRPRGGLDDAHGLRGWLDDVYRPRGGLRRDDVAVRVVMAVAVTDLVRLVPAMVVGMMMAAGNAHNCCKRQYRNYYLLHIGVNSFFLF